MILKKIKKDIDIISLANNEYRDNILKNIDSKFNIKYIDLIIFGESRDNIFKKSKIYINIHCLKNIKQWN
jgi:accessory colonization factor AcfC